MTKIRNHLGRNFSTARINDKLTPEARSLRMKKIKSKRTSFEVLFFEKLNYYRIEFEAHPKEIFGKPDIFVKDQNLCVFLDSNFWHGWQYPRWKHKLKNDFWCDKIERNRKRDRKTTIKLRMQGYKVLRLWEHQIKNDIVSCITKITKSNRCV